MPSHCGRSRAATCPHRCDRHTLRASVSPSAKGRKLSDTRLSVNNALLSADGDCIAIGDLRVGNFPIPERVVDGDEATGTNQFETALVVVVVIAFVGVDESVVERFRVACGAQFRERVARQCDVQFHLVHQPHRGEMLLCNDGISAAEFTANEFPVGRKPLDDRFISSPPLF